MMASPDIAPSAELKVSDLSLAFGGLKALTQRLVLGGAGLDQPR